ncbi:MAG: hypothetical protein H5T61_04475 [Thermoflexales bacterium]|nr:hypothetical protein [Thermoflexales bacterium]
MKQRPFLWGAIALLVLAAIACSLGGKTATPPPAATGTPPSGGQATPLPPSPTEEPATEEAPPLEIAPNALENLNSYRARLVMRQTVEGGATETLTMEQEETREPAARRIVLTAEGGDNPGTLELVQIGDTSWMCSPDSGCIQTQQSAEEATQFGEGILFKPEDFASSDYRYVGRDTVNGVRSRHYTLELTPEMLEGIVSGTVTATNADIWVADEAGMPAYVTRLTVSWEGTQEDGKKIQGDWTYEVYDVNKPITIQPPEGATGAPEDIPIYPGATDQTIMGTLIMFSSADPVEDVAEFYRNEMPGQGWTAGEESTLGNVVMQEWTKGDRKASLMISPKDEGGCTVMISIEQP